MAPVIAPIKEKTCFPTLSTQVAMNPKPKAQQRELVIADAALADIDVLLGSLASGTEVWRVVPAADPAGMIMAALRGGYRRLHFLGHGAPGSIRLGARNLNVDDFTALAAASGTEASAFPSFHFWSCSTGAGEKGYAFVDALATISGRMVSAFSGLVGAKNLGGSWVPDVFSSGGGAVAMPFVNASLYACVLPELLGTTLNGRTLSLNYDVSLDSGNLPSVDSFLVKISEVVTAVSALSINGSNVVLTLASAVEPGSVVSLSYTDPSSGNDPGAIQDSSGNDAASFKAASFVISSKYNGTLFDTTGDGVFDQMQLVQNWTDQQGVFQTNSSMYRILAKSDATYAAQTFMQFSFGASYDTSLRPLTWINDGAESTITWQTRDQNGVVATAPASFYIAVDGGQDVQVSGLFRFIDSDNDTSHIPDHIEALYQNPADTSQLLHFGTIEIAGYTYDASNRPTSVNGYVTDLSAGGKECFDFTLNGGATVPTTVVMPVNGFEVDSTGPNIHDWSAQGSTVTLRYNELLDSGHIPLAGDFTVKVNGSAINVTNVSVAGNEVLLTLASAVGNNDSVSLSYTDPSSGNDTYAIQDVNGNDAMTIGSGSSGGGVTDTTPPQIISAYLSGMVLTLNFNEAIDSTNKADKSCFVLKINGQAVPLLAETVAGNSVLLARLPGIPPNIPSGSSITVSYSDPSVTNDQYSVQDLAGNDAASFTDYAVTISNLLVTSVQTEHGLSSQDYLFKAGETIVSHVYLNQQVQVSGSPQLQILIGEPGNYHTVFASYNAAQSSGNHLVFSYSSQASDIGEITYGNLVLPAGSTITNQGGMPLASPVVNYWDIPESSWLYSAPTTIGTSGNDWVAPAMGTDLGDYIKLTDALAGLNAGSGGDRDVLAFDIVDTTGQGYNNGGSIDNGNGLEGNIGGRIFRLLNEGSGINLYELVGGTPHLVKTLHTDANGGFERLLINLTDVNGNYLSSVVSTLKVGLFSDLFRNQERVQGSDFTDAITLPSNPAKSQFISPGNGDDVVIGSDNRDVCDISYGNKNISLKGGDDSFGWWGSGTSILDGGTGNDTLTFNKNLSGSLSYNFSQGKVHLSVGGTEFALIEQGGASDAWQYRITTTSDRSNTPNDMVATLKDIEYLNVTSQSGSLSLTLNNALFSSLDLTGTAGNDVLTGDAGDNHIDGGAGDDTLYGMAGNDQLLGGPGKDVLDGGDGNFDWADYSDHNGNLSVVMNGSGNATVFVNGVAEDTIRNIENIWGGSGNDVMTGDDFGNLLHARAGNDTLYGGAGDDQLRGDDGNDVLDGGSGVDWADYREKTAGVVATLNGSSDATVYVNGVAEDTIRNIENVFGGSGADSLTGDGADNIFDAGWGNDTLLGGGGNDNLQGGVGNDLLRGGNGLDFLDGGDGIDVADYTDKTESVTVTLNGSSDAQVSVGGVFEDRIRNIENVWGGTGNDMLTGDGLDNRIMGGGGQDTIDGGAGNDAADYTDKTAGVSVTLNGSLDATVYVNGVAEDTIRNIENLFGGSGNDTLTGDAADNIIRGGGGNDVIDGGAGNDQLRGASGNDTLDGGTGSDWADYQEKTEAVVVTLNGSTDTMVNVNGVAEDTIRNIENLFGGSGNDFFTGDGADNSFNGGLGNDTLRGGIGHDILDGGDGIDTADYTDKTDSVTVTLSGSTDATVYVNGVAEDTIRNIENVWGSSGNDILTGDGLDNRFMGLGGQDTIDGGAGSDGADYSDKTDSVVVTLHGSTDATVYVNGAAEDTIRNIENLFGGSGNDTLTGDSADNVIRGGGGNDFIDGGAGNDQLRGGPGNDTLEGGAGSDWADYRDKTASVAVTLNGSTDSHVTVDGIAEDTIRNIENIFGGSGNDSLTGDGANNIFNGGSGNDTIVGGSGNDTAVFSGNFADYTITYDTNSATFTVTDKLVGRDGTDVLASVENLRFADVTKTAAVLTDHTPPGIGSPSIAVTDTDNNHAYSEGDTVIFTFSEPVRVDMIFNLSDSEVFSAGKTMGNGQGEALNPVNGCASQFRIAFGSGFNLVPGDTLTIPKGSVVDEAGNVALNDVTYTLPALSSGTLPVWDSFVVPAGLVFSPGQYVSIDLTAHATDADGDSITYSGTFGQMINGVFTVIPSAPSLSFNSSTPGHLIAGNPTGDLSPAGSYVLRVYADDNTSDSNPGTFNDVPFTISASSTTGPFTLVPDANPSDKLLYTFNVGIANIGRLYDDNTDGVLDHLTLYTYKYNSNHQVEQNIRQYSLDLSGDNTWIARSLLPIVFGSSYDPKDLPTTLSIDGGDQMPVSWQERDVNGVVATVDMSFTRNGMLVPATLALYDSDSNNVPDSGSYTEGSGASAVTTLFSLENMVYQNNHLISTDVVIQQSIYAEDLFHGTIIPATALHPSQITLPAVNNDSPWLNVAASPSLAAIVQHISDVANTGTPVSDIVVNGSIQDSTGVPAPESIAVTGVDAVNGSWQYKVGSGAWTSFDFTAGHAGTAVLLDSTDRIRFVPVSDFVGTVNDGINFLAWDKTTGSAGEYLSIAGNFGAWGTLSDNTDTASITVYAAVNSTPTGGVTVTGTATQGETLTAHNTLADADGLGTISYQWQAGGVNIEGATGSSFILTEAQVNKVITVVASYTDGLGTHESVSSSATTAVANLNDQPTGNVIITGTATQGETLTASNTLADADGLGPIGYQWQAEGMDINGATVSSYTLTQSEVGKSITVAASYTDGHGTHESMISVTTEAVLGSDHVAPEVLSFTPADAATGVSIHSNIILKFSEAVHLGSGSIEIHSGSATGSVFESFDAATSSHLLITGDTLIIDPSANLANVTDYYVTFSDGSIQDLAGNHYAGTSVYDFTTAAASNPSIPDLTGSIKFWKTGAPISGVMSTISSVPAADGSHPVEFRTTHVGADGSRTIEIWETSSHTDIDSLQLELTLPAGSTATWQDATSMPSGWVSLANADSSGHFILGGFGLNALSAGPVKLGTLSLSAPVNPSHFELQLTSGLLANDAIPAFGIISDTSTTGVDGLYEHLDIASGGYILDTTKAVDASVSNAVKANDALAALKIAVNLNPNGDGSSLATYQYLAADVNKDGKVNAADALNILKMAVHLDTAPASEWLFVPDSVGAETMNRTAVHWPDSSVAVTLDQNQELQLIGIVKGDVNGSWT